MNTPSSPLPHLLGRAFYAEVLALLLIAGILGSLTFWLYPLSGGEEDPGRITWEQLTTLSEPVLWVDARSQAEFEQGSVPNAIHLHPDRYDDQFPELLLSWTPETTLVVFCAQESCGLSQVVAEALREDLQTDRVFVLSAGWNRIQEEGGIP